MLLSNGFIGICYSKCHFIASNNGWNIIVPWKTLWYDLIRIYSEYFKIFLHLYKTFLTTGFSKWSLVLCFYFKNGVSCGSLFSMTLFSVIINSITTNVQYSVPCSVFVLYVATRSMETVERALHNLQDFNLLLQILICCF